MIIMIMISVSNVFFCIIATHLVLRVCVDSDHRIGGDRIDTRPGALCHLVTPFMSLSALRGTCGSLLQTISKLSRIGNLSCLAHENTRVIHGEVEEGYYNCQLTALDLHCQAENCTEVSIGSTLQRSKAGTFIDAWLCKSRSI